MKKILLVLIISLSFIITGCGCTTHKKEDIIKKYSDYWKYSLGDYTYEVTDEKIDAPGGLSSTHYKLYSISFNDYSGRRTTIKVSNYSSDFNKEIEDASKQVLDNDKSNIVSNLNSYNQYNINISKDETYFEVKTLDTSKKLYDSINGVKLNKLNLKNLGENNLKLKITVYVNLDKDLDNYPELKNVLYNYVKYIYDNYDAKNIETEFNIKIKDIYYSKYLTLSYDGYKYKWMLTYYGNTTDEKYTVEY